jgi:hypothetical protein
MLGGMNDSSNPYQEPLAIRVPRLQQTFNDAVRSSADINKQAVQSSLDVAKEKTQYLEKVSIGCGATVALIVTFLGAHAGHLRPEWLLRSALVVLVLAMMFGFLRNWIFPWYTFGAWGVQDYKAKLNKEDARRALISTGTALDADDGQPIDVDSWLHDFEKTESDLKSTIDRFQKMEKLAFDWARRTEYITLGLASGGMALLVALAWINF